MTHERLLFRTAVAVLTTFLMSTAEAQFPSEPIEFVVPYGAGGALDALSRTIAKVVSEETGYTAIVVNKPGASGAIGTNYVAKSKPDGHTLLVATLSHVTNQFLTKDLPWHPTKDFKGVALLTTFPSVALVNSSISANTLKEFVGYAKRNPGKVNYLNPGIGTSMHLNTELLKLVAGIDLRSVLYKGTLQGIPDLLSGRISFAFAQVSTALGQVRTGKVKPLFIAASRRNSHFPDVLTAAEAGYADAQVISWYAILAPANVSHDRIAQINKWVNAALARPDVQKWLENAGAESVKAMSPNEVDAMLLAETGKYATLIKDAKIEGVQP